MFYSTDNACTYLHLHDLWIMRIVYILHRDSKFSSSKLPLGKFLKKKMSSLKLLQYSKSDREEILKVYGRTSETVQQDIENIKVWFTKQPHLPEIPNDKFIENFLLMNKFRIEKCKKKLDMYYSVRSLFPEFYDKDPNSPIMQKGMSVICSLPLPKLTKDFNRIVIAGKAKNSNPDNFDAVTYAINSYNYIEMRLREDCNLAIIYIYDLADIKPGHLTKFTPTFLKKLSFITQNVFANKIHATHLINAPSFLDSFLFLVKGFLKPKAAERIFIHKTLDTLYEVVPRSILPKDYGGEEKSLEELNEEWKKTFLEYDSLFKHLRSLKVKEELRPGKPLNTDILGIEGNFRKLAVD